MHHGPGHHRQTARCGRQLSGRQSPAPGADARGARNLTVSPDGDRVVFARSRGGNDPVNCLWCSTSPAEPNAGRRPARLLAADDEDLPPEERARRERAARGGRRRRLRHRPAVTSPRSRSPARLFVAGPRAGHARRSTTPARSSTRGRTRTGAGSPTSAAGRCGSPSSTHGWRAGRTGTTPRSAGAGRVHRRRGDGPLRGYWWSPAATRWPWRGSTTRPCSAGRSPIRRTRPRPATEVAYPAAGTANAGVTLRSSRSTGEHRDRGLGPTSTWPTSRGDAQGLLVIVQTRDQTAPAGARADPSTGATTLDPRATQARAGSSSSPVTPAATGALVTWPTAERGARLIVDGEPVTPPTCRSGRCSTSGRPVMFRGDRRATSRRLAVGGQRTGLVPRTRRRRAQRPLARRHGGDPGRDSTTTGPVTTGRATTDGPRRITSLAERPAGPNVTLHRAGEARAGDRLCCPTGTAGAPLPVLLDPYGGPHAQRVRRGPRRVPDAQWFADQGFAVVVVDGRGTPGARPRAGAGRAPRARRAGARRPGRRAARPRRGVPRARPVAGRHPRLVVRRLHGRAGRAAAAGRVPRRGRRAPGHRLARTTTPTTPSATWAPGRPARGLRRARPCSRDARQARRPLLLVHGLADDNVVAAHTLRLSSALLAAGRPHRCCRCRASRT